MPSDRACGMRRYLSLAAADQYARHLVARHTQPVRLPRGRWKGPILSRPDAARINAYRCPECGFFHVGKVRGQRA